MRSAYSSHTALIVTTTFAAAGTVAFGCKGGIGTSSRVPPAPLGGWTVGVPVLTRYRVGGR